MAQVYLDPEAIRNTQVRLRGLRDMALREAQRHAGLTSEVEHLLRGLAGPILSGPALLHSFDPVQQWEQSGLSRMAQGALESYTMMDEIQGQIRATLEQLCAAHGELVGGRMSAHSEGVGEAVGSTVSTLWDLTVFFGPGNLLWFLREPWAPCGRFNEARARLEGSATSIAEYIAWLDLLLGEEAGIEELLLDGASSTVGIAEWINAHPADVQESADILGHVVTVADGISELSEHLHNVPHMPGWAGDALDVLGFAADVVHGGTYKPRDLAVDANSAAIGFGIGLIPVAGEVYAGLGVASIAATGTAWGLQQQANFYDGRSRAQIEQLSNMWEQEGNAIDPDHVTHDLGGLASDFEGAWIQAKTFGTVDPGIGGFGNMGEDIWKTAHDVGSLAWGISNRSGLAIDTATTEADVLARSAHAPSWLQGPLDWAAGPGQGALEAASYIVLP